MQKVLVPLNGGRPARRRRRILSAVSDVTLRAVEEEDLEAFFLHQLDPEATAMAAFPARERDEHFAHWQKVLANEANVNRTILFGDEVAGNIAGWPQGDMRLVGYWIGRDFWGKGIATDALRLFVAEIAERPLHAFVATTNVGSIRVLEKCGFTPVKEETHPDGITELLMKLA